jgi:hypothetical protein
MEIGGEHRADAGATATGPELGGEASPVVGELARQPAGRDALLVVLGQ